MSDTEDGYGHERRIVCVCVCVCVWGGGGGGDRGGKRKEELEEKKMRMSFLSLVDTTDQRPRRKCASLNVSYQEPSLNR